MRLMVVPLLGLWVAFGIASDAQDKLGKDEAERLDKLIRELDSKKVEERVQATKAIERFGLRALPVLEKAAKKPPNLEVARRLGLIIWKLRAPARAEEAKRIAAVIPLLGSPRFEEREAAAKKLEAFGRTALSPLYEVSLGSDVEIVRRAQVLIEKILSKNN